MMAVHDLFFVSFDLSGRRQQKSDCISSRAICPSQETVTMKTNRHLLHDLTVAISSSSFVGLHRVPLLDKNRLALIVGARCWRTFQQSLEK